MTDNPGYPHWLDGNGDCRKCGQHQPDEGSICPAGPWAEEPTAAGMDA